MPESLRIAVISRVFSRSGGGAESYSVALVKQLCLRHDIHVFSQESDHPVSGVTYHPIFMLSRKPRWVNQLWFAIATWLKTRRGFNLVHSHENTWHGQIQTIHVRPIRCNLFLPYSGWRLALRWLKVALSPRLITYVLLERARFKLKPRRKTVASSDSLRIECEQAYPFCAGRIPVIAPGTDLPMQSIDRLTARNSLKLPLQGRLVLFVANDYAKKGLDTLLVAVAQLGENVSLVVVGKPGAMPKYVQMSAQLGLTARVHFLGPLNEVSPAYWACDCLVHPTQEDTFAMVVLEAMAHGLPVVVSAPPYCGISNSLVHGEEALLLDNPNEAGVLAKLIASVLHEPALAEHLRGKGLAFAQRHSWESAALEYESLYQQVGAMHTL
jgi:glycosyltransferase involved in cell wall biosynthesis